MKQIINKLFEKLGYVPKSMYENLKKTLILLNRHYSILYDGSVLFGEVSYSFYVHKDRVVVYAKSECYESAVKSFFFNIKSEKAQEEKEYALICANELCDMLNAKY